MSLLARGDPANADASEGICFGERASGNDIWVRAADGEDGCGKVWGSRVDGVEDGTVNLIAENGNVVFGRQESRFGREVVLTEWHQSGCLGCYRTSSTTHGDAMRDWGTYLMINSLVLGLISGFQLFILGHPFLLWRRFPQ